MGRLLLPIADRCYSSAKVHVQTDVSAIKNGREEELSITHQWMQHFSITMMAIVGLAACQKGPINKRGPQQTPPPNLQKYDADVLIVGAGLAGLSASIDAARGGARVIVIDMNSVFGGHGIQSGGIAVVGSPMQEALGFKDSPELAISDWAAWAVDGHPEWTRFYAENSRELVYDWVTGLGATFDRLRPSHGNSMPRFHLTYRRGLNLLRPLFMEALRYSNITFRWNANAENLLIDGNRVAGAKGIDWRNNHRFNISARITILATGGFQSNIELVKENWPQDLPAPGDVYSMSGQNSRGSGHRMAAKAGAALINLDRQYNGYSALPNVLGLEADRGFVGGTDQSIWVNEAGERFVTESGTDRFVFPAVMHQQPSGHWSIYDDIGKLSFSILSPHFMAANGADNEKIQRLFIENMQVTQTAETLEKLAEIVGLPADVLIETVSQFNAQVINGESTEIDGIPAEGSVPDFTIVNPPFYATKLYPMANKSAGGVSIDLSARTLHADGSPVPGLYAAGEITGSAGINGLNGLDGMFTGPAILTGRVAGRTAVSELVASSEWQPAEFVRASGNLTSTASESVAQTWVAELGDEDVRALLALSRDGYWHFERVHQLVLEREYKCAECHSAQVPFFSESSRDYMASQAQICDVCHLAPERPAAAATAPSSD